MEDGKHLGDGCVSDASAGVAKIRVVFIIRRFECGGAERQLITLLRALDKTRFDIRVITLYAGGVLWDEAAGIPSVRLAHLGKRSRWHLGALGALLRNIREARPHIVHGYMDVANVLALAGRIRGAKIVWGMRASKVDMTRYDYMRRLGLEFETRLSRLPDLIICNSRAALAAAEARGFPSERSIIIPNGIDTERFRPDPAARVALRAQWHVSPEEFLVGIVGRLDPMKGHAAFFRAAVLVLARYARLRLVVVGGGGLLHELRELAAGCGIQDRLIWAGQREEMSTVFPALDLTVSASLFGEGFPNVLAESMACGVPCVSTDVGDSSLIIQNRGWIAPPGDPAALAESICRAIHACEQSAVQPQVIRERIISSYSIDKLAESTSSALCGLLTPLRSPASE